MRQEDWEAYQAEASNRLADGMAQSLGEIFLYMTCDGKPCGREWTGDWVVRDHGEWRPIRHDERVIAVQKEKEADIGAA